MTIKAAEAISIEGSSITMKGSESVTVQGPQITVNADEELQAKGGMTTNIQGGTQVSIKGAMVQIN